MHVALVSGDYPPQTLNSGVGTYTRAHANCLTAIGHRVTVITPTPDVPYVEEEHGVHIHRIDPVGSRFVSRSRVVPLRTSAAIYARLRQINKVAPIDVVEFQDQIALGVFSTMANSLPVVARGHGTLAMAYHLENKRPDGRSLRLQFALSSFTVRHVDLVVAISNIMRDFYAHLYGLSSSSIAVQHLPLSAPDIFLQSAQAARVSPRPNHGDVVFLHIGRQMGIKRTHIVVEAFARANVPGKRLTMIGDDTETAPDGGSMRGYCIALARRLGVTDRIQILNRIPQEDLLPYYLDGDILVAPSLFETFGLVYLEAMAIGLPVIGTTEGSPPEFIRPECGLLVRPDDLDGLTAAMEKLGIQPELRREMGESGQQLVREQYTPEAHAKSMVQWYKVAIARHRTRLHNSLISRTISRL